MKIMIDIDEDFYEEIKQYGNISVIHKAILDGTPLPKGHGRLIDADEALNAMDSWDKFGYFNNRMFPLNKDTETEFIAYVHYVDMVEAIYNAPTIIEAERGEE